MSALSNPIPLAGRRRSQRAAPRLMVFLVLLVCGTLTVINLAPQTETGYSMVLFWLLTAAICTFCLVPIILESRRSDFELITARNVFVLYCLLQFVLSPVVVDLGGYTHSGSTPITSFTGRFAPAVRGQAYVASGMFLFQLTYSWYKRRSARRSSRATKSILRINSRVFPRAIFVLVLTSLFSFWYLAHTEGGIMQFLAGIEDFRDNRLGGTGPLYAGMYCMYFAFVIAYYSYLESRRHGKLTLILFILAILIGFLGAYRHLTVETVVTAAVMRHYGYKRIAFTPKVWLVVALFICVNLVYVAFRVTRADTALIKAAFQSQSIADSLYDGLFSRFNGPEPMARVVDVTDTTGYTGAPYFLVSLATFWVPRALWPSKPPMMTVYENVLFFPESFPDLYTGGAAAPTVEGTFYWFAGLSGLLIGMGALGVAFAFADRFILRRKDLFGFAFYTNAFIFAAFVAEMLDLHFVRFLVRAVSWYILFLLCGQRVPLPSATRPIGRTLQGPPRLTGTEG